MTSLPKKRRVVEATPPLHDLTSLPPLGLCKSVLVNGSDSAGAALLARPRAFRAPPPPATLRAKRPSLFFTGARWESGSLPPRSPVALRDDDELVIDECEAELAYIFARPSAEAAPGTPRRAGTGDGAATLVGGVGPAGGGKKPESATTGGVVACWAALQVLNCVWIYRVVRQIVRMAMGGRGKDGDEEGARKGKEAQRVSISDSDDES